MDIPHIQTKIGNKIDEFYLQLMGSGKNLRDIMNIYHFPLDYTQIYKARSPSQKIQHLKFLMTINFMIKIYVYYYLQL